MLSPAAIIECIHIQLAVRREYIGDLTASPNTFTRHKPPSMHSNSKRVSLLSFMRITFMGLSKYAKDTKGRVRESSKRHDATRVLHAFKSWSAQNSRKTEEYEVWIKLFNSLQVHLHFLGWRFTIISRVSCGSSSMRKKSMRSPECE